MPDQATYEPIPPLTVPEILEIWRTRIAFDDPQTQIEADLRVLEYFSGPPAPTIQAECNCPSCKHRRGEKE